MERPRILILFGVVLLTAATMAVSIIVVSHGDDGLTLLGERLRMLRYAVIGVGAMVFVGVAWWTMAVGVNAARLDGDRSPWWTASTCFGWWLFLPGAVYVDATTSGWQAVVGVGLMSVVAMYGHARLAGLARCYDMRYVACARTHWRPTRSCRAQPCHVQPDALTSSHRASSVARSAPRRSMSRARASASTPSNR